MVLQLQRLEASRTIQSQASRDIKPGITPQSPRPGTKLYCLLFMIPAREDEWWILFGCAYPIILQPVGVGKQLVVSPMYNTD